MRKTVQDGLPGATQARSQYLRDRLDRALRAFDVTSAHLRLDADLPTEGVRAQLRVRVRGRGTAPIVVEVQRRSLPAALEELFESVEYRLTYGVPYRRLRRRAPLAGRRVAL